MYHNAARDTISSQGTLHYALTSAIVLMVIIVYLLVFRPMIRLLLNEEDGTKLLLRMIPSTVRQDVPAIAEYLETGTITQNEKMQRINEAVTEMSVVPLVVIDWSGKILRISKAATDEFNYEQEETLGQNVKMLMPEEFAQHHDTYLQNYRNTGVAKILDLKRRVTAMRKDGSLFPVEILVREFKKSATESQFLGYIRNISTEIEFERATRLNEAISDMSQIPVLVINPTGTIVRFNKAVTQVFGYSSAELNNKNVKMLMQQQIADMHDKFLDNYMVSGVKNVIDSSRKAMAVRKNGKEFPIELTVKELLNERNQPQFFVGYVKDITHELLLSQSIMANEAVIQISPTPVININPQGIIMNFSPSAEATWGYSSDEVIGKNVRILMTDEDAKAHDGYLARYAKSQEKHMLDSQRVVRGKKADGSVFWLEANIKELRKDDHVTFIGYLRDLTQDRQTEFEGKMNQMVYSASPSPIVVTDEAGLIQQFNVAAERQLGWRADQVLGQNVKILMPEEVAQQHDSYLKKYRETGIKTVIDESRRVTAIHRSGKAITFELQVREVIVEDILDETGCRKLYIGYLRDVTEEHEMQKANELNDVITRLSTVPMVSIDIKGTILTFSDSAAKVFGYAPIEVIGENVKKLMPPAIASKHDGYLQAYRETGVKHILDKARHTTAMTKNGKMFPCELRVKEIAKQGIDPVYIGYVRDTSEEVEFEDAKLVVDTISDTSPTPIIVINAKGIIVKFSAVASQVFGWAQADICGKNIKILMTPEIAREHDTYLRTYMKTGITSIIGRTRVVTAVRKDGLHVSVEIMVREVKIYKGGKETVLFVGYLRDLSQEYILRQSNELKDVILSQSSVPMVQIDTNGAVLYTNSALLSEFQYSQDEIMGANVKCLMPDDVAKVHDGYLRKYLQTRKKKIIEATTEMYGKRRDGTVFPIALSVRELQIDGKTTYFGYMRNLKAQLEVREQKMIGDTIVELTAIPLVIIDDKGIIQLYNQACAEAFRYSKEEAIGQNVEILMPPDVAALHNRYIEVYNKTKVKNVIDTTRRVTAKRKSGKTFPVEISVRELIDPTTGRSNFIGYLRDISDEYKLQVANELAETVTLLSPVPLIVIGETGKIKVFSKAAQQTFGWTDEEVIDKNVSILQTEDIAAVHDSYLQKYLKTGKKTILDHDRQVVAQRKDGSQFPALITVKEVRELGMERVFVGFVRELTKEIQHAQATKSNENIMRLIPTPLIVINPSGTVESINSSVTSVLGYEEADLVGENVKLIMQQEDAAVHDGHLERYKARREKKMIDNKRQVTAKSKSGTLIPMEIYVKEVYLKHLEITNFFAFLRDTREEQRLQRTFALNDAVTDMSIVPIVVIDSKGIIMKFSKAACEMTGYDAGSVVGKNVSMLMTDADKAKHDTYLAAYVENNKKASLNRKRKVTVVCSNGSQRICELTVSEVEVGTLGTSFVGFLRDCTEEIKQEADRELSSTISSLSHLAVIVIEKNASILEFNAAACELFGYTRQECIGQNVRMLMPPEIAAKHDMFIETYFRTKVKRIIDSTRRTTGKRKGGALFPIEVGVKEVVIQGVGERYVGYIRDISSELAIAEAKKMGDAILSMAPLPMLMTDEMGIIIHFTDMAASVFGYTKEQVVGKNVTMLMPHSISERHDEFMEVYNRTGVKKMVDSTSPIQVKRADGRELPAEITLRELVATDGTKYFIAAVQLTKR